MELENLSKKTLADLREIAKMAGIKSVTIYRKDQLLQKLQDLQAAQTPSAAQEFFTSTPGVPMAAASRSTMGALS